MRLSDTLTRREMKTNHLLCPGDACPLRHSCRKFQNWLNSEDDEDQEMTPDYHEGECMFYEQKTYYGG